jgi:hypothetical protein
MIDCPEPPESAGDSEAPFPLTMVCPIDGGTMHLIHDSDPEWFYRCETDGAIAFP